MKPITYFKTAFRHSGKRGTSASRISLVDIRDPGQARMTSFEMNSGLRKLTEWRIEGCIFIAACIVYGFGTSHNIVQGDTGEFLATAAGRGIPHDPSYPLYSIITQSVFLLTHNVWALHALSGLFSAVALVFVYKIIVLLTKSQLAAIFSVLSLSTYEFFFFNALIAQVHALHVLILAALYYFLLKFLLEKQIVHLYLVGVILGLGVAHNHTIIFAIPSVLLVLFANLKQLSQKKILYFCLCGTGGLALYAYTFFTAFTNPHSMLNWGRITDVPSFLAVFFRTNYGSLSLTANQADGPFIYSSFVYFFKSLLQTSWFVLPFAIASLYCLRNHVISNAVRDLFTKSNQISHKFEMTNEVAETWSYLIILGSWVLTGPLFYLLMHHYMYTIVHQTLVEQFLPYSFFFLSLLAGLGFNLIVKTYRGKQVLPLYLGILLFFSIVGTLTFIKVNQTNSHLTEALTKQQLSQIPKHGILITVADSLYFPTLYWQYTKHYRSDIIVINLSLLSPWYIQNLLDVHPELARVFPNKTLDFTRLCTIYGKNQQLYLAPWYQEFAQLFNKKCTMYPYGLIAKVVPNNQVPKIAAIKMYNDSVLHNLSSQVNLDTYKTKTARMRESLYYLSEQLNFTGLYYQNSKQPEWAHTEFTKASTVSPEQTNALVNDATYYFQKKDVSRANQLLEEGIRRNPADANLYYTLGILKLKQHDVAAAYKDLKQYLSFSPPKDQSYQMITNFVTSYEKSTNVYGH